MGFNVSSKPQTTFRQWCSVGGGTTPWEAFANVWGGLGYDSNEMLLALREQRQRLSCPAECQATMTCAAQKAYGPLDGKGR